MALAFALTTSGSQCRAQGADGPSNALREAEETILAKNSVLFENPAGVSELADFIASEVRR